MKLGIYGGSFSPPHEGHFKSALAFYDECTLDRLLIIPAKIPPHKSAKGLASGEDRIKMLRLCFSPEKVGGRQVEICDFELTQEGTSYTYLTLQHFAEEGKELFLLVGSDMFLTLDSWNRPEEIFALATVVLNPRENNAPLAAFEEKKALFEQKFGAKVQIFHQEPLEISSSALRRLLSEGLDPAPTLLDPKVLSFIKEKKLFNCACPLKRIREDLKRELSAKRVEHIFAVEREIVRMAPLFGLEKEEEEDLQRAALLHDLTHEKSFEEQQALFTLYGVPFTEDDRRSPAVVHQITGALVALDRYGVSPRCASAIACHTTGKEEMTLFEKLLCLADYVEEGRAYPSCIALRELFYGQMPEKREERLAHLDRCMLIYFENTVAHLEEKGGFIHPQTIAARNFLKTRRKDL